MRPLRFLFLATLTAVIGTACARGVTMNPEVGEAYAVNVVNEMPHPMIISYDDGVTTRTLGTVGAERQDRFVVAGAQATTITIIARDEAGTHTVRRTITLSAGGAVQVRIN